MSIKLEMRRSSKAFLDIVWPQIRSICGGGIIAPVEAVSDIGFVKTLDTMAGVDAWQIIDKHHVMRGIASRVQYGRAWNTYTIRYKLSNGYPTEYEKRMRAITKPHLGMLYPHLTVQAYIGDGRLLSAAVVATRHLYDTASRIASGQTVPGCGIRVNPQDGNQFIYVRWDKLERVSIIVPEAKEAA